MSTHLLNEYDVLRAIYSRRAVRAYQPEQPHDDTIHDLLAAAVQAPTAMHAEPWAFAIVQDRARLKRYSDRAECGYNIFYDAGTLIVICRRQAGPFADADCWLAAENLMLAATARGLGTCCIGLALGVLNQPDVKQELGIPREGAAVAPIILGTPRAAPLADTRRAPQILKWLR